jgi:hypothetical protein
MRPNSSNDLQADNSKDYNGSGNGGGNGHCKKRFEIDVGFNVEDVLTFTI